MKTKFKGFINLTIEQIDKIWSYNNGVIKNGDKGIAIDKDKVIIKCGCSNCGDITTINLTKLQIKKINLILNNK